ncbi:MAG: alpha/beta fold hydrolase [Geminicoccaceae bacterium]|nr:alpha/beta fold hydrolase [Geminicoccaceae bacterium]
MSIVTLRMPRLGETMEEGTVAGWLLAEGERFERGAPLIEFETDKTAVEYPALGAGRLVKLLVAKGDLVKLGDPIAEIDLLGGENWVDAGREEAIADDDVGNDDRVIVDLPMPRLGETMEEGRIVGWMVEIGASYERGAPILEVETDKTVAEFPALVSGRLVETLAVPGDLVKVNSPIARVELARSDAVPPERSDTVAPGKSRAAEALPDAPVFATRTQPGARVRATPVARRAARKAGIDIETLRGSGRRGRVELVDVTRVGRGGALAASSWGPADGASVLLVHGFAGDRVTFEQIGKTLGRAGLAVRAIDLPAHGETLAEAHDFDGIVAALAAELDPARPVHLVGHSLGAAAAAVASRKGGVSSLTLIAPAGLGLSIDAEFVEGMARAESVGSVGHLLRRLSDRAAGFSAEAIAEIHEQLARGRLRALAADICRGGRQTLNVRGELARLAGMMPVRIIVGQQDRIIDWRDALDVSSAIALHVFPRAGHMPQWDAPAEVAAIIQKEGVHV